MFDLLKSSYESFDFKIEWILEGAVFSPRIYGSRGVANNEGSNAMNSHKDFYEKLEEEQVEGEFTEENNFTLGKKRKKRKEIWREIAIGILESDCRLVLLPGLYINVCDSSWCLWFHCSFLEDGSSWNRKYLGKIRRLPKFVQSKNQMFLQRLERIEDSIGIYSV